MRELSESEKEEIICSVKPFSMFGREAIKQVITLGSFHTVGKKQIIVSNDKIFFVLSGVVYLQCTYGAGKDRVIFYCIKGDCFIISPKISYSAKVIEDAEVFSIALDKIDALPPLLRGYVIAVRKTILEASERIFCIAEKKASQKLLIVKDYLDIKGTSIFDLTHAAIAELLNLDRATVTRKMKIF